MLVSAFALTLALGQEAFVGQSGADLVMQSAPNVRHSSPAPFLPLKQ